MTDPGKVDFRRRAHEALDRARLQLAGDAPGRLRYVALELRLALEALAYQTAQTFSDELPESAYKHWQPPRMIDMLREIDPRADRDVRLRYRPEGREAEGTPWRDLGEDRRTPLKLLKKVYQRVGSLLHIATLAQIREGKDFDEANATLLCQRVFAELERVLASPVWSVRFKRLVQFPCGRCEDKQTVVVNVPSSANEVEAKCRECSARYVVKRGPKDKLEWNAVGSDIPCPKCKQTIFVHEMDVAPGTCWTCSKCGSKPRLVLALTLDDERQQQQPRSSKEH